MIYLVIYSLFFSVSVCNGVNHSGAAFYEMRFDMGFKKSNRSKLRRGALVAAEGEIPENVGQVEKNCGQDDWQQERQRRFAAENDFLRINLCMQNISGLADAKIETKRIDYTEVFTAPGFCF